MSIEQATHRLAEEMVQGEGVHQVGTLNRAKVRVLAALHYLDRPCTDGDLAVALDWTRQYAYRMVDELTAQGVLVRSPGKRHATNGRPASLYSCICQTDQEGTRS